MFRSTLEHNTLHLIITLHMRSIAPCIYSLLSALKTGQTNKHDSYLYALDF